MPRYRIQTPDGRTMVVEADSESQALSGVKSTYAASQDARKMVNAQPAQLRKANQGASFGFDDEVDAGLMAAKTGIQNLGRRVGIGQGKPYTAGQAYDTALRVRKEEDDAFARAHPVQAVASEVGGGLLSAAPGIGAIRTGATALRELPVLGGLLGGESLGAVTGRAAATGGLLGGTSGAGNAQPGQRVAGAARGAATGAAVAPATMVAGNAASGLVKGAGRMVGAVRPDRVAFDKIASTLRRDGANADEIRQVANEWMRTGASSPAFMDVVRNLPNGGEATMGLIRGAAVKAGPGRSAARTYTNDIAGNLQDRVINRTNQLTPNEPRAAQVVRDELIDRQGRQAGIDYAQPNAQTMSVPDEALDSLGGRPGRDAIAHAMRGAEANRETAVVQDLQRLLQATDAGGPMPQVSGQAMESVRRAFGELGGAETDAGNRYVGKGLFGRRENIDEALDQIPEFGPARANFRDFQQQIEAIPIGQGAIRAAPAQLAYDLEGASPQTLGAAGIGYRQSLIDELGRPTENATGAINRIATSTNQSQNLSRIFGADEAGLYQGALGNEAQRLDNARFINPNTNSATAGRASDAEFEGFEPSKRGLMDALSARFGNVRLGGMNDQERASVVNTGIGQFTPEMVQELERALQARFRVGATGAVVGGQQGGRQ